MSKRQNESEAPDKKRAKVDMLDSDPEVNIPEGLEPDNSDHESDKQTKLTSSEKKGNKRFRVVLFAACVDPKLINTSTEKIGDSWATEYKKVKTAFFNVVKTAVKKKKILYPSNFNLLKEIFPSISF